MIKLLLLFTFAVSLLCSFRHSAANFSVLPSPLEDTAKPYIVKGKRATERQMDSLIELSIKQTMDSLRARRYIVKQ